MLLLLVYTEVRAGYGGERGSLAGMPKAGLAESALNQELPSKAHTP